MPFFPNVPRCQHLKVNGTQCGSPALRRNRLCFFHKRFQEERIKLNCDRARRGRATFILPVLEDANSIQVSLMQIMRLLVSGQIDTKTASLLLYALQTATLNLRRVTFEPSDVMEVVIDRRTIDQTCIGGDQWCEEDFEDEEEEAEVEEEDEAQAAAQAAQTAADQEKIIRRAKYLGEYPDLAPQEKPPAPTISAPSTAPVGTAAPAQTRATDAEKESTRGWPEFEIPGYDAPFPAPATPAPVGPAPQACPEPSRRGCPAERSSAALASAASSAATATPPSSTDHKKPGPPEPAAARPNKKKEAKNVDIAKVRKEVQNIARDWIMETVKQQQARPAK